MVYVKMGSFIILSEIASILEYQVCSALMPQDASKNDMHL